VEDRVISSDTSKVRVQQIVEPLRAALASLGESDRYGVLATVLSDLATHSRGAGDARGSGQMDALNKKVQALANEKAEVEDTLRSCRADLDVIKKQLEAEQARASERQQIIDDQRTRLQKAERELKTVEAEVVARNNELHRTEGQIEDLQLQLQRASLAAEDHSKVDNLEESRRELMLKSQEIEARLDKLRAEKDAEIEAIKSDRQKAESVSAESADKLLLTLWQRMATTKPPLSEGHIQPNKQAAERLVDAFIEIVRFVDDFEKSIRVFLGRYTKHHPSVRVPWDAYAKGDDLLQFVRRTVAAEGGRPVGPLKMRLRLLYSWTQAGMVGCDSAIESIGSELQSQLMGPIGAGSDPNKKIRDYIRDDGHLLFAQHISELRSLRLAETFGRG